MSGEIQDQVENLIFYVNLLSRFMAGLRERERVEMWLKNEYCILSDKQICKFMAVGERE